MNNLIEKYNGIQNKIKGLKWIQDYTGMDVLTNELIVVIDEEIHGIKTLDFNNKEIEEILVFRNRYQQLGNFRRFKNDLKDIVKGERNE